VQWTAKGMQSECDAIVVWPAWVCLLQVVGCNALRPGLLLSLVSLVALHPSLLPYWLLHMKVFNLCAWLCLLSPLLAFFLFLQPFQSLALSFCLKRIPVQCIRFTLLCFCCFFYQSICFSFVPRSVFLLLPAAACLLLFVVIHSKFPFSG